MSCSIARRAIVTHKKQVAKGGGGQRGQTTMMLMGVTAQQPVQYLRITRVEGRKHRLWRTLGFSLISQCQAVRWHIHHNQFQSSAVGKLDVCVARAIAMSPTWFNSKTQVFEPLRCSLEVADDDRNMVDTQRRLVPHLRRQAIPCWHQRTQR